MRVMRVMKSVSLALLFSCVLGLGEGAARPREPRRRRRENARRPTARRGNSEWLRRDMHVVCEHEQRNGGKHLRHRLNEGRATSLAGRCHRGHKDLFDDTTQRFD